MLYSIVWTIPSCRFAIYCLIRLNFPVYRKIGPQCHLPLPILSVALKCQRYLYWNCEGRYPIKQTCRRRFPCGVLHEYRIIEMGKRNNSPSQIFGISFILNGIADRLIHHSVLSFPSKKKNFVLYFFHTKSAV